MRSSPSSSLSTVRNLLRTALRFKWAGFSAVVVFTAVYWVDTWFVRHGLRRDATLLDTFLLGALVFSLGVAQQLRHERELRRQRQLMNIIADMNHHTRNALQVIVNRSSQSIPDPTAIDDIRQAVRRIDWCLREILSTADERTGRKQPIADALAAKRLAKSQGSGR